MNSMWSLGLRVGPKSLARVSARNFSYSLPTIPLLNNLKVNSQPFQGLFSNDTLDQLWFQRGDKLVNDLNHLLIQNNITPPADLNELISLTFNKSELHGIYSYASILHNLQFFLENLKPANANTELKKADASALLKSPVIAQDVQGPTDEQLQAWIVDSFGSMSEFKTLLLNSANGIKGDGITWLIAQPSLSETSLKNTSFATSRDEADAKYTKLAVINTYNAGIVDDSIRSGQIHKLTQQKAAKEDIETVAESVEDTVLGSVKDAEFNALFQDRKIIPLLAIDASMRNYLLDYGVFGKQDYLENVWNCIDWDVVAKRSPPRFKQSFEINF